MISAQNWIAYIGTYTTGVSKGIYAYGYQPETGDMKPMGLAAETLSPSFLAMHPNGRVMYAVNESQTYKGLANSGGVSAFTIDSATARLTLLNTVATHGADPCHLVVDHTGRWLLVANYSGGSIAVFPIHEDGSLGEATQVVQHTGASKVDPQRQEAAHVHSVNLSDDNRFLYVSDLGLDSIFVYRFDAATGKLTHYSTTSSKPGAGPRHIAFTPDRRFAYSFAELDSRITFYSHKAATAELQEIQSASSLPAGFTGPRSGAEIAVDPSGRFLYASNRGHDSIATFSIDAEQGLLHLAGHVSTRGRTPRHFTIDPTGTHLFAANQDTSSIATFSIDQNSGVLTPKGDLITVGDPVCILFVKLP